MKHVLFSLLVALAMVPATSALALPRVGSARPDVRLVDAWDRGFALASLRGTPVLVVYEDKESGAQNDALKKELARAGVRGVTVVAIADVDGYDYWPARGFVKDAIKEQSQKLGAPIYCDWDGKARSSLGMTRGTSNVVLYAKSGAVAFAHAGPMPEAKRKELIALMRAAP
jgi:hypothetical protein